MIHRKLFFTVIAGVIIAIGCGIGNEAEVTAADAKPAEKKAAAAPAPAVDATKGAVTGVVTLKGGSPVRKPINFNADPVCAKAHKGQKVLSEEIIAGEGGELKNVIVYIDGTVAGTYPTPAQPAVLDQKGCMYEPQAFGLMSGQTLEVRNSDKTLHNVHCYLGTATCFNRAMFQGMAPIKHEFKDGGKVVKFKCDVHPWMTSYALIATNPFFAVTDAHGAYAIRSLPAGEYTLAFWHPVLGKLTQTVNANAGAVAQANASFEPK